MTADDYKKRLVAEYRQLAIRKEKLQTMIENYETDKLSFKPTCSIELYKRQLAAMTDYAKVLEERARLEDITL